MGKKKRIKEQRLQGKRLSKKPVKPKEDARAETIDLATAHATSPANRAKTREYIQQCGSPVMAAKGIFLSYTELADKPDPRFTVACRAGCWFCCTIPVAVTPFEAALVWSAVQELPEEDQQAIWIRTKEYVDAEKQALADAGGERAEFRRRCPLLTDDGRCSVYASRPLVCRGLLSMDADRCRRSFLEGDEGDPNEPFSLVNHSAISGIPQLMITLNEGKLDHYANYELASALYALWSDPELFTAWQRGEHFAQDGFPFMAEQGEVFPTPKGMPIGMP